MITFVFLLEQLMGIFLLMTFGSTYCHQPFNFSNKINHYQSLTSLNWKMRTDSVSLTQILTFNLLNSPLWTHHKFVLNLLDYILVHLLSRIIKKTKIFHQFLISKTEQMIKSLNFVITVWKNIFITVNWAILIKITKFLIMSVNL